MGKWYKGYWGRETVLSATSTIYVREDEQTPDTTLFVGIPYESAN